MSDYKAAMEEGQRSVNLVSEKEYSLDALLSGINDENIHPAIAFGEPVGKEIL